MATKYCRRPCSDCPWRVDAPAGMFPAERFRLLANTAYDISIGLFACHNSTDDAPSVCAGFLLRGAEHNLSVRMMLAVGEIDRRQVSDGGVELYESYRDMAVANGVSRRDPALRKCR